MRDTMNANRNTLPAAAREISTELLNGAVADSSDLYGRTQQTRWMVRGQSAFALHKLLDEFEAMLQAYIDADAKRGWMREPDEIHAAGGDQDRGAVERAIAAGDSGAVALLTELVCELDKQLRLLEAHLHGNDSPPDQQAFAR